MKNIRNRVHDHGFRRDMHPDPNMNDAYWWNQSKAQTAYLVSVLSQHYPAIQEAYKTPIEVPPGKIVWLLHRYFTVHSRDGTAIPGAWVKEEAIHEIPPSMLIKPETLQ